MFSDLKDLETHFAIFSYICSVNDEEVPQNWKMELSYNATVLNLTMLTGKPFINTLAQPIPK